MAIHLKVALDNTLIKVKKSLHSSATVSKQLKYFSNADNSTILTPPESPVVLKEAKSSLEFEFGGLVH